MESEGMKTFDFYDGAAKGEPMCRNVGERKYPCIESDPALE